MPAAGYVTVALVVVVVLVLAAFLIGVARVLIEVNKRLDNVIGAVGSIATATAPVDGVVRSINGNLATARDVLNGLLVSKVGADGAAELVASVDPLAEAPPTQMHEPIQYERPYQPEVADEAPAPLPATGAPIQYERAYDETPPWGAPPEDDFTGEPERISLTGAPGESGFEPVYEPEPAAEEPPPPAADPDRISLTGAPGESGFEPVYEPEPAPWDPEPEPAPPEPEPAPPPPPPPEPGPAPGSRPRGSGGGGVKFNLPDE